jgi:hypothetical protein
VGAVIAKDGRAVVEKIQSDLTPPFDGKRGSEEWICVVLRRNQGLSQAPATKPPNSFCHRLRRALTVPGFFQTFRSQFERQRFKV